MPKDYSKQIVKNYKFWSLQVHSNQGYLGRCVIMCLRSDAEDYADMTEDEHEELLLVIKEAKKAISKAFGPDWFNYAFLGNEYRHLHCHLVPRYEKEVGFLGIVFADRYYGKQYRTDMDFATSDELLFAVRDEIIKCI